MYQTKRLRSIIIPTLLQFSGEGWGREAVENQRGGRNSDDSIEGDARMFVAGRTLVENGKGSWEADVAVQIGYMKWKKKTKIAKNCKRSRVAIASQE